MLLEGLYESGPALVFAFCTELKEKKNQFALKLDTVAKTDQSKRRAYASLCGVNFLFQACRKLIAYLLKPKLNYIVT